MSVTMKRRMGRFMKSGMAIALSVLMTFSGLNLNFLTVQAKEADVVSQEESGSEELLEETSQAESSEETSQTESSEEPSVKEESSEIASEADSEAESKEGEENPSFEETTEEISDDSINNISAEINQTAVTYDMDSLSTSAKHTKEEIAQRYTRLQNAIVSEADFMKTAPSIPAREVTTNCVFAGGQMNDASHQFLTELVNYYRYLIGVPEFSQNSVHSDSLQAAAVVRFYNPTINPAFSGVHSQMPSSFFELGTRDSINVFSQILNAGSYSSMAEVGIRYGLINVGIATDSSTKQNYVSNIQTRQELLSYKVQGMNFGYVSNSLVGLATGKNGSATDYAYMFPSAGYFPNEAIDPTTTSWSFELNPNVFGSQNTSNLKVTVQNITKGTDAYECTFANKKLIAGGGDAYAFEAPTDYVLKKYRDDYQVTITGLQNKSGEAVTIKYTVRFFDVNECYQTSVKEVRLITGSDAIFIDYNVDINDYQYVAQIIPKNAIAVCENGREFEIVADQNWQSDGEGSYLVNTFLKAKNNLPENVDDKNNILSSASIEIVKGSYGNTEVLSSDKSGWISTAADGDEICISLLRSTKYNTTVECIYRIEMDGTITKIADQNSANRTPYYNKYGNLSSTDFRITLNESGKYRYFGYHAYEGTDGFYVTKPSEELTITGLPRIKYNLNSQNFADICNIQNSSSNPIKYSQNQSITLANPTAEYLTFDGWYLNSNFTGSKVTKVNTSGTSDITLYAKWVPVEYTITYVLNGGTNPADAVKTYHVASGTVTLPEPSKTGNSFAGWCKKSDLSDTPMKEFLTDVPVNLTLYAKWAEGAYTVSYNSNYGTVQTIEKNYSYEEKFTILGKDTFTRNGYTLSGWNTKSDGTGTTYTPGQTNVSKLADIGTVITLYAKWTPNDYTVTFDSNGGSEISESLIIHIDQTYQEALGAGNDFPRPTRDTYVFLGWFTAAEGGTQIKLTDVYGKYADTTLYAHWEKMQGISLVFYTLAPESEVKRPSDRTVYNGYEFGTLPVIERTGYEFTGWYLTEAGAKGTKTEQPVKATDIVNCTGTMLILYAGWSQNAFTVTFNATANGGTCSTPSKTVYKGRTYGELPTAEKANSVFNGWFTATAGGTKIDESSVFNGSENITLYAQFTERNYIITFDTCCDIKAPSSKNLKYGDVYGTMPELERTGYKFLGWFTTKVADDTAASKTAVKATDIYKLFENQTLYARWEANQYKLSFDSNLEALDYNPATREVTYGQPYGELPVLEHSDYTFLGWYKSTDANAVKVKDTDTYYTLGDETLYAHWEMSKKVSIPTLKILNEDSIISDNSTSGSSRRITLYDDAKGVFECETLDAQIYYLNEEEIKSLNGGRIPSEQKIIELLSENGKLQTDSMILSGLCENSNFTIYAIAKKSGYYNSPLLTAALSFMARPKDAGDVSDDDMIENGYTDESGRPDPDKIPNAIWVAGVKKETKVYNGKAQTFDSIRVYDYKTLLTENIDYKIKYSNNIKAGTGKITIFGNGNYNKTLIVEFPIEQLDLSRASVTEVTYAYNGKVQKGKTTVTYPMADGNVYLKEKTDFEYVYNLYNESAFKEPGSYQVTVQGKGNYKGSLTFTERIIAKEEAKAITKMKFSKIPVMNATGAAIVPGESELVIMDGEYTLQRYRDYSIVCRNNIKPGTATVTITGMGKYTGVKNLTFKIQGIALNSKNLVVKNISESGYNYTGNAITLNTATFYYINADGVENYLNPQSDIDISYSNNVNASTKATITIKGKGKYTGTVKKTFTINKITAIEQFEYTYDTYQNYTKGGVKPEIKIRANLSTGMKELVPGKDYSVAYSNNKALYKEDGQTTKKPCMIITFKGNYLGKMQKNFYILPGSLSADAEISAKDIVAGSKPGVKTTITLTDRKTKSKLAAKTDYDLIHAVYTYNEDTTAYQMVNKVKTPVVRRKGEAVDLKNDIIAAGTTIRITIKGAGNYEGSEVSTIIRCTKKSIASASVTIPNQVYTGKAVEPGKYNADTNPNGIKVKVSGKYLETSDYEIVSYTNNVLTGSASVTIKGVGEYGGVKTVKFKIVPKAIKWKALSIENLVELFR